MEEGRVPLKRLKLRFILVTLVFATPIPYQVLTGCPVNQLLLLSHSAPLVLLYKSTKASESFTSTWALAVVKLFATVVNRIHRIMKLDFIKKGFIMKKYTNRKRIAYADDLLISTAA